MTFAQWFEEDEGKNRREKRQNLADKLDAAIQAIWDGPREMDRRKNNQYDLELYFGRRIRSLFDLSTVEQEFHADTEGMKFNIVYSVLSTIRNRICSFRPRSEFIPDSGNGAAKSGAEDLSAMNEAWSKKEKRQKKMALWMRDLLTKDGAVFKVYREGTKIRGDRFPCWEFLIDEVDGMYGSTSTIHHVQWLPVDVVAKRYDLNPDDVRAEAREMLPGIPYAGEAARQVVRVADSYASASSEDDEDFHGRHVILVGRSMIVLDEDWEFDEVPMVIGTFEEGETGVWGQSAISFIRGLQTEQNEWTERMRDAHYNTSLQVWQLPDDEEGPSKVTNGNVRINRYQNKPAEVTNPAAMSAEAYRYSDLIEQQVYKTLGVSPFIAQAVKQSGVTSGIQQDATSELQTDRLALLSQLWETSNNEVDKWWMRLTARAARDGVVFKWRGLNKGAFHELVFDHGLEEWEVEPQATSVFGQTVSARLTKATELLTAKAIDLEQWTAAVNLPDLKPITDIRLADSKAMEAIVDRVLEKGMLRMPGPYLDPQKMYAYAKARYNLAAEVDTEKYSTENLAKLRRLVDAVGKDAGIIPKANAPQLAPSPAPAAAPIPGMPAAGVPAGPLPPPVAGGPIQPSLAPDGPDVVPMASPAIMPAQ